VQPIRAVTGAESRRIRVVRTDAVPTRCDSAATGGYSVHLADFARPNSTRDGGGSPIPLRQGRTVDQRWFAGSAQGRVVRETVLTREREERDANPAVPSGPDPAAPMIALLDRVAGA